ncbi:MAG TPA: hypothetical protein PKB06_10195, partial [Actinotalea sp.]|nr:hypothetical protein [Actinotalea sp.]
MRRRVRTALPVVELASATGFDVEVVVDVDSGRVYCAAEDITDEFGELPEPGSVALRLGDPEWLPEAAEVQP